MTAATDLDTMHRAVLLDPADDLARLALADACEEAGELGRAEFVRQGVGRPGLCYTVHAGQAVGVGFPKVYAAHTVRCPDGCASAVVRRGLVESVSLPLAAFLAHAEALFRAHPITAVTLTDREFAYAYWVSSGRAVCSGPGYENHGAWIPHLIFRHLKGATIRSARFRGYADLVLARAALSAACVVYGRALAGLPPLPVHPPADTGGHGGGSPVAGAVQPL